MPVLETRPLPSGAIVDLETHVSPEGLPGVVAHWGVKHTMGEIHNRLALQGIEENKLSQTTGFRYIYRQQDGIERKVAREDELTVAETVANTTLEANGWLPTDVDAILLGSGVPPTDDPTINNYAQTLARRMGMRVEVIEQAHSTYAACTSGAHEFFNALTDPELQGKKVLVMGMEGITTLTPDFDINRADPFSIQVFSNGAAGLGIVPGQDMRSLSVKHDVIEDTVPALAAHMTYERLLDPENPEIWQEDDKTGLHLIRLPQTEKGKLLALNQRESSVLFADNTLVFAGNIYKEYMSQSPTETIVYIVAHPASEPILKGVSKRLGRQGVEVWMPWVVDDGNSSAATTLIAHNRMLSEARGGTKIMVIGYGAGASFDGGVIEYGQRA